MITKNVLLQKQRFELGPKAVSMFVGCCTIVLHSSMHIYGAVYTVALTFSRHVYGFEQLS